MDRFGIADVAVPTLVSFIAFFVTFRLSWDWAIVGVVFALANLAVVTFWFHIKDEAAAHKEQFMNGLRIGAHRGCADDVPENTMSAVRYSSDAGVNAIELDLEFTRDGLAVALHDDTVDRTTDGKGKVGDLTWNEVKKLNAVNGFDGLGFEGVPLFEDAMLFCIQRNIKMFIDVKATNELVVPWLLSMFKKHKELYTLAAVCSFYPQVVYQVKRQDPYIVTAHTWRPGIAAYEDIAMTTPRTSNPLEHMVNLVRDRVLDWALHNWLWKLSGANLFLAQEGIISKSMVTMWRKREITVVAWTVNDRDAKLFFLNSLKVPFLTDSVKDIADVLRS